MFKKSKARKHGPLKALQSVLGGEASQSPHVGHRSSKSQHHQSHHHHHHQQQQQQQPHKTKDDMSMARSQRKEKVKANPYATIKMWRPIAMTTPSRPGAQSEDVYQTFTNFDAFRQTPGPAPGDTVGALRNGLEAESSPARRPAPASPQPIGRMDRPSHSGAGNFSTENQGNSSPATPSPSGRRVSFQDQMEPALTNGRPSSTKKSSRPPPLPSSPPPLPSSPPPALPSPSSPPASSRDTSFQVVSDGATTCVKLVLSHSYGPEGVTLAAKDVERLLAELKLTMDSLRSSRIDKNSSQLHMCRAELHSQTKQFVQDAKQVVSSANNSREKMAVQLQQAVHTLARLFLHGQATMLMMPSPHGAQHLGFQLVKAANAFKSTVSAANAAVGKSVQDPHMKYLMRQATNLATLLASLLTTIKEIDIS